MHTPFPERVLPANASWVHRVWTRASSVRCRGGAGGGRAPAGAAELGAAGQRAGHAAGVPEAGAAVPPRLRICNPAAAGAADGGQHRRVARRHCGGWAGMTPVLLLLPFVSCGPTSTEVFIHASRPSSWPRLPPGSFDPDEPFSVDSLRLARLKGTAGGVRRRVSLPPGVLWARVQLAGHARRTPWHQTLDHVRVSWPRMATPVFCRVAGGSAAGQETAAGGWRLV